MAKSSFLDTRSFPICLRHL